MRVPLDLSGQRFGTLMAVELVDQKTKQGLRIWKCICDCGREVNVPSSKLTGGIRVSCGCKDIRVTDYTGKRIGKLTGLTWASSPKGRVWKFKCDCGNIVERRAGNINLGAKHCGCGLKSLDTYLYITNKCCAEKRDIAFKLTLQEFRTLIYRNCYYCDTPPSNIFKKTRKGRKETLLYSGIDRIDSNGVYEVDNCIPCCMVCNRSKSNMSVRDFLIHIKKIYAHLLNN